MRFKHFFVPHEENSYKAHLLKAESLLILVVFLLVFLALLKSLPLLKPGILGISSKITKEEVISLTNEKRKEKGLVPVYEDERLTQAAAKKAQEMFSQGYWAHNSPAGKTPWEFIKDVGYRYLLAGENLARDFSTSTAVVNAWMDSPTHRANILEAQFRDIGVAVVTSNFNGYQSTLVVQMFGKEEPVVFAQKPGKTSGGKVISTQPVVPPLINQYRISQFVFLTILFFLALILLLDAWWTTKAKIIRISSHSGAHFLVLGLTILALLLAGGGAII